MGTTNMERSYEGYELQSDPNIPPWIITPKEEKLIFDRWRKKAFAKCDDLIKAYVKCSNSYKSPVDSMKNCKHINEESLACVAKYQTQEYLDIERDILVEQKKERRILHEMYAEKKRREAEAKSEQPNK
ncbi:hypothetical protein JA1_000727 [Spathaspora sp. JA1]|nr:hypothetical protein JA1_000727 [Spathaspora sp. JA1]